MSGQLTHAGDESAVHEAYLLAPEDRDEPLQIAVQEIEEPGLLATFLQRHEAADGRAIDERYLNGHRAVRHVGGGLGVGRCRLDAGHLLLRDKQHFLFIEEEREERRVLVQEIDRLLRLGADPRAFGEEYVAVESTAIREDDANGPTQLLNAEQSNGIHWQQILSATDALRATQVTDAGAIRARTSRAARAARSRDGYPSPEGGRGPVPGPPDDAPAA